MQLKEEFRSYEALRREHDAQIVHIAMEAGLRISPEQWSSLLYGDLAHKSHMQSIIDKVCEISDVCFISLLLLRRALHPSEGTKETTSWRCLFLNYQALYYFIFISFYYFFNFQNKQREATGKQI